MAGYVVISTDGTMVGYPEPPTLARIDAAVGPEGWARVRLDHGLAGFVNDSGFLLPDTYPRNPVGACLLAAFGAGLQPYAGPVVVTGWDATPRAGSEIRPFTETQQTAVSVAHGHVVRVLADRDVPAGVTEEAAAGIRAYAGFVRSAPAPELQSVPVETLEELGRIVGSGRRG